MVDEVSRSHELSSKSSKQPVQLGSLTIFVKRYNFHYYQTIKKKKKKVASDEKKALPGARCSKNQWQWQADRVTSERSTKKGDKQSNQFGGGSRLFFNERKQNLKTKKEKKDPNAAEGSSSITLPCMYLTCNHAAGESVPRVWPLTFYGCSASITMWILGPVRIWSWGCRDQSTYGLFKWMHVWVQKGKGWERNETDRGCVWGQVRVREDRQRGGMQSQLQWQVAYYILHGSKSRFSSRKNRLNLTFLGEGFFCCAKTRLPLPCIPLIGVICTQCAWVSCVESWLRNCGLLFSWSTLQVHTSQNACKSWNLIDASCT